MIILYLGYVCKIMFNYRNFYYIVKKILNFIEKGILFMLLFEKIIKVFEFILKNGLL